MRLIVALIFSTTLLCSPVYAAIYEWLDEHNTITFSQKKPTQKNIPYKKLKDTQPSFIGSKKNPSSTSTAPNTSSDIAQKFAEKRALRKQAISDKQALKKNCADARASMTDLERGGNPLYRDAKGNYLRLDQASKQAKRDTLNQFLSDNCQ